MMTKLDAQRDALPEKIFDLKVTLTQYGTVSVKARNLEEAKETASEMYLDDMDWSDWDWDFEEDV